MCKGMTGQSPRHEEALRRNWPERIPVQDHEGHLIGERAERPMGIISMQGGG